MTINLKIGFYLMLTGMIIYGCKKNLGRQSEEAAVYKRAFCETH